MLDHLGDNQAAAGRSGPAAQSWELAVSILDELSHHDTEHVRGKLQQAAASGSSD
jgi:hypothetical protein